MIVDDGTELPMPDGTQAGADLDFGAVEGSGLNSSLDQTVTLTLGELLPDSNGEIVIVNAGDDPQLQIVTELKLLESGVANDHLTESGLQVGGFNYWVFEDGTKLFYAPGMSVELQHHG
ncbi:hypothetical protein [Dongia deserti]|uniref:hypothetical protein n=1 Tax=Dongia deserti TaxID=2268030 RepID=UPI000E646FE4|nr:hypothetical protein [Dongia deserti]